MKDELSETIVKLLHNIAVGAIFFDWIVCYIKFIFFDAQRPAFDMYRTCFG